MYGEVADATLQEYTSTENELGETIESWSDVESFPSRLSRLDAERRYESNRYTGVVEWRLYADIDKVSTEIKRTDHRIVYGGDTYKIESVNDVDKLGKRYQVDLVRTD